MFTSAGNWKTYSVQCCLPSGKEGWDTPSLRKTELFQSELVTT